MIYFNYITNPCEPNKGRISRVCEQSKTIWQIIKEQKVDISRPILCLVNGVAVLRKDWNDALLPNSVVSFVSLPLGGGGGGSNPLKTVLTVALIVATVYTGGAVGAAYGAVWGGVAAAGVSMAGGILINTLVPTPKPALCEYSNSDLKEKGNISLPCKDVSLEGLEVEVIING